MLNLNPTWLACEARTAACSEVKLRKVPVLSCTSIMWLEGTRKQKIKRLVRAVLRSRSRHFYKVCSISNLNVSVSC